VIWTSSNWYVVSRPSSFLTTPILSSRIAVPSSNTNASNRHRSESRVAPTHRSQSSGFSSVPDSSITTSRASTTIVQNTLSNTQNSWLTGFLSQAALRQTLSHDITHLTPLPTSTADGNPSSSASKHPFLYPRPFKL
jgi:hypothetical protein